MAHRGRLWESGSRYGALNYSWLSYCGRKVSRNAALQEHGVDIRNNQYYRPSDGLGAPLSASRLNKPKPLSPDMLQSHLDSQYVAQALKEYFVSCASVGIATYITSW